MLELKRWSPFGGISTLHRDIDELFRRTFEEMGRLTPSWLRETWYPPVDCFFKEGNFVAQVEVSGIDPKDIDISVLGNQLTIKGQRKSREEVKEEDYLIKELYYGSFERTITLPEGVISNEVHATYNNGVLEVSMPCEKAKVPKRIHIEVEGEMKKAA